MYNQDVVDAEFEQVGSSNDQSPPIHFLSGLFESGDIAVFTFSYEKPVFKGVLTWGQYKITRQLHEAETNVRMIKLSAKESLFKQCVREMISYPNGIPHIFDGIIVEDKVSSYSSIARLTFN